MRVPQAFALGACWPGASRVICGQRELASPFQAPGCRAGCRRVSGHLETRYLVRAAEDTARGRRWFPKQLSWTRIPGMGPEQATGTGSRRGLLGALRGRVPGRAPATDGLVGEAVSKALRGPFSREAGRAQVTHPAGSVDAANAALAAGSLRSSRLPPGNSQTPTRWTDGPPRSA